MTREGELIIDTPKGRFYLQIWHVQRDGLFRDVTREELIAIGNACLAMAGEEK